MKKILMFATYPIAMPQHGGQKRVSAIYKQYEDRDDLEPHFCAVYVPTHYDESWKGDIKIPSKYITVMNQNPLTTDLEIAKIVTYDNKVKNKIRNRIQLVAPDIIELEHPFLYLGIKKILEEIRFGGKIIYSSHNIEYKMKEEMLLGEGIEKMIVDDITAEIKNIEESLIKDADLIYAVSDSDAKHIIKLGATADSVIVARNGIEQNKPQKEQIERWKNYFRQRNIDRIALFVGSAHPPNWTGYQKMIGHKVGFLNKSERIVLAGSIGDYLSGMYGMSDVKSTVFNKRVMSVGRLSQESLAGLLEVADVMLLPIVEGGGSNLKTAEALLSAKPIVATEHAFRAFEDFKKFKNVCTTNNQDRFLDAIKSALNSKKPNLTNAQKLKLKEVTWERCLEDLGDRATQL